MFSLEKAMEQSTIGFAKHQLIYDEKGNPKDYLFLSLNPAFERLTGLKREVLLNRRVTEVMPEIAQGDFDWFGFFGNIVTERKKEVFEHYSASLDKWYRVEGLSCEKDCFTTLFTDITNERELVHASKTFLDDEQKTNTYEEITQRMKRMTGADYVALNVFFEESDHFQTVAIVGIPGALQKAATLLGFNPLKKEWAPDPHRMALIREKKVTTFEHLHELTQHVLSKKAIQLLEKTFHLGQTVIIKSTQGEKIIGDFTLMFSKGNELQNENEAIIYADMVGMLIERRKGLQKLAEKETALREAKDNLQNITDNMLDLVSVTDMAGKYRFAGPSHKILGYEIDKLIGRNVMHFVHPEDLPQVEQEFVNFIRQKTKNPKVTYRYQRSDGNYLWFETLGTFILDQKGEPKEILFNTRDITKQKEMEAQLQENQIRLEYAMDSGQHGFWDMNLDTDEIYCSPGYYKLLGYEPDEFPITPAVWRSFIHPDDRPYVPDIRDYLEKQEQKELYFRVKCKGNRFKWIASKAKGHERDSQGIPHRAVGVHVEVDELKQKNEALKEAHQMAKMGRWDYYHKQDHLQWSEEVFDLFELDSETFEANYKAFIECVHPDDRERVIQTWQDSVANHHSYNIEHKILLDDGRVKWVKLRCYTEYDENDRPQHSVGIVQDITEQKQYEEQLSIFKTISDKALYGFAMADREGNLTYTNPYFAKVHGYTPEELQGRHISILHLKKHLPAVKKTFDEMNETRLFRPQEIWHAKKDGGEFPMLMSGIRFEKRVSVPEFYATSAIDISQQKKQQEALSRQYEEMKAMNEELVNLNHQLELSNKRLQTSEEKLSTFFQSMTEHVVIHELVFDNHGTPVNYRILECNRRFTEVTGIPEEQAVGKLATEVYGAAIPPYLDVYASMAMNGTPRHFETFFPPMEKHFSISAVSMGKNRFATITSDITEQKKFEEKLRKSEEKHRRLFETMSAGVIYQNADGNIISANPSALKMLGLSMDQICGKTSMDPRWKMILPDGTKVEGKDHPAMIALRTGKKIGPVTRGIYHVEKDTYIWLSITAIPLFEPGSDKPFQAYATFDDVSERKKMEEQLIHAKEQAEAGNKAKSVFLANMNHELRTPLNGIIGYSDILRTTTLDEEQKEFVEIVYTSGKHLADIITDILDLSRIEAGKFELNQTKTNLKPLIENTISIVRPKAENKGLCLSTSIEHKVPDAVEVDGSRLRQVLLNLIANAVKFTDEGTVSVTVSLLERQLDQARLLFKVTDTGMGIKEEEQIKIFEPFHQADMSISKKAEGTGLGLVISKKLLEMMGTTLELESEYGKGSTFSFELLLTCEKEQAADTKKILSENIIDPTGFANKKVLIAEDNPINMQYAQTAITMLSKDIHVIHAKDGKEAYQLYREQQPDLILMDIIMPQLDGYQVTAMIRAHDKQTPIIAMTAKALQEDKEDCLAVGMNEYLTKPVSLGQLKDLLNKYL